MILCRMPDLVLRPDLPDLPARRLAGAVRAPEVVRERRTTSSWPGPVGACRVPSADRWRSVARGKTDSGVGSRGAVPSCAGSCGPVPSDLGSCGPAPGCPDPNCAGPVGAAPDGASLRCPRPGPAGCAAREPLRSAPASRLGAPCRPGAAADRPGPAAGRPGPAGRLSAVCRSTGPVSPVCEPQSRSARRGVHPSDSMASSMTAQVWVDVASADGSLVASAEYPGSASGSPGAPPGLSAPSQAARVDARFHDENWPGGYTGSACPGNGG